ncbi:uncharacterized protein LOC143605844 [Bidens hawaiensis]|uniref:uncharacterized protein LOC143605844 n=1 Tax=Bidens hawaiensis TaxID=980011 RepID=UPI0040492430
MVGAREVVGIGARTECHGRPGVVRQPSVESASNTREEGSAARQNPSNNEGYQLDLAIQSAIVQAVAAVIKNLTPKGSARSHGRTAERSGENVDKVIRISECRPNQAVGYVTQSFGDEAMFWWETVEQRKTREQIKAMKWDDLKELVMKCFCADAEFERAELKFLNLKTGKMTHRENTTEFNLMSRLVPNMVNTEAKRIKCYIRGLPQSFRTLVRANKPATFYSAVELAEIVYDDLATSEGGKVETKKKNPTPKPDEANEENPLKKKARKDEFLVCGKCGKKHSGECIMGLGVCFRCGEARNSSWECRDT